MSRKGPKYCCNARLDVTNGDLPDGEAQKESTELLTTRGVLV
jgi:hypothetical protein